MSEIVRQTPDGTVSAALFRYRIGTGGKLAIHILEYFDHVGLTRRQGDTHRLSDDPLRF